MEDVCRGVVGVCEWWAGLGLWVGDEAGKCGSVYEVTRLGRVEKRVRFGIGMWMSG